MKAEEIKTVIASPLTGLIYVSASLYNHPPTRFRMDGGTEEFFLVRDEDLAEVKKVFPDVDHFRPGEWADTRNNATEGKS